MKKLELKNLLSFAPYKVKGMYADDDTIWECDPLADETDYTDSKLPLHHFLDGGCKLILYPLSWLTKEIEHNGEKFVPAFVFLENDYKQWELEKMKVADYFKELKSVGAVGTIKGWSNSVDYRIDLAMKGKHELEVFQKLFEWHFDVFGLLKAGLAIDKSTIK